MFISVNCKIEQNYDEKIRKIENENVLCLFGESIGT